MRSPLGGVRSCGLELGGDLLECLSDFRGLDDDELDDEVSEGLASPGGRHLLGEAGAEVADERGEHAAVLLEACEQPLRVPEAPYMTAAMALGCLSLRAVGGSAWPMIASKVDAWRVRGWRRGRLRVADEG